MRGENFCVDFDPVLRIPDSGVLNDALQIMFIGSLFKVPRDY